MACLLCLFFTAAILAAQAITIGGQLVEHRLAPVGLKASNPRFSSQLRDPSNVNLHVSNGATIKFGIEHDKYLPVVLTRCEGTVFMEDCTGERVGSALYFKGNLDRAGADRLRDHHARGADHAAAGSGAREGTGWVYGDGRGVPSAGGVQAGLRVAS